MNKPKPVRETEITGNADLQLRWAEAVAKASDVIRELVQAEDYVYVCTANMVTATLWGIMVYKKKGGDDGFINEPDDDGAVMFETMEAILSMAAIHSSDIDPDDDWIIERELIDRVWPIVWGHEDLQAEHDDEPGYKAN